MRIKNVLNLYAGIGGNRLLWGNDMEVTAIENNPKIANVYQDLFPDDKVFICDAHEYLVEHFGEYDFIWSSPPCPTHSMFRKNFSVSVGAKPTYPDMKLYEEILLLKHYFIGKWVVENVKSYYKPLITPQEIQRHYFWANFEIVGFNVPYRKFPKDTINLTGGRNETQEAQISRLQAKHGINLDKYTQIDKRTVLRNCVTPELGLFILTEAKRSRQGVFCWGNEVESDIEL